MWAMESGGMKDSRRIFKVERTGLLVGSDEV